MIAPKNSHFYDKVIFHSFWEGELNEKVVLSMKSCWYFHQSPNYTRILWVKNHIPSQLDESISAFCEIKQLESDIPIDAILKFHILYTYGGCWFEPSIFFLRSIGPLFFSYNKYIMTYQSGTGNTTNTNLFVSLLPNDTRFKKMIDEGLHTANGIDKRTFADLVVLPCSWFDGVSLDSKYLKKDTASELFKTLPSESNTIDFSNWYRGSYCMCWNNEWDTQIEPNSVIDQLSKIISA